MAERTVKTHEKSIAPQFYEALLDGRKLFEIRRDKDGLFAIGDLIRLKETRGDFRDVIEDGKRGHVVPGAGPWFTGREAIAEITFIYRNEPKREEMLAKDFCVLGLRFFAFVETKPNG